MSKRRSAIDPAIPWRPPGVDPTAEGLDRAAAAGLYGFDDELSISDMDALEEAERIVFDEALDMGVVASDAEVVTYLGGRTENPAVAAYDWSGFSLATYHPTDEEWTHSIPTTLISESYGICAAHNVPLATGGGSKVWFREPDGDIVVGTVDQRIELSASKAELVHFSSPLSASLKRYPIVTRNSMLAYAADEGLFWTFYQNLSIKLFALTGTYKTVTVNETPGVRVAEFVDGGWEHGAMEQGSGRPCVVPLTDGTLVLIGTAEQPLACNDISLNLAAIASIIAADEETFTTYTLPGYTASSSNGRVNVFINDAINRRIRVGIRP